MNYEDTIWINQQLYSYNDVQYHTEGYMELVATTTTQDKFRFSQPKLTLSISNENKRRICNLSQSNCVDLLQSLKDVTSNLEQAYNDKFQISKRYNKNRNLMFVFSKSAVTGENCVVIRIVFSDSDFGTIIIPYFPEFVVVVNNINKFVDQYQSWCRELKNSFLLQENIRVNNDILLGVKSLPSYLSNIQVQGSVAQPEMVQNDPSIDTSNIDEFSKFIDEHEEEMVVPELDSTPVESSGPITQEFKSELIDDILECNLERYEDIINASFTANDVFAKIRESLIPNDVHPAMTAIQEKSLAYFSNYWFKLNFMNFQLNGVAPPIEFPPLLYAPETHASELDTERAYDLLMIASYVKAYRNKREYKSADANVNGAIVHFATRCFVDILSLSFLDASKADVIKSCVISRYKHYKEKGLFTFYDKNLEENTCAAVELSDIENYINLIFDNVIGKAANIEKLHQGLYEKGQVKLPPENDLSLEQITNEFIPIEVQVRLGKELESLTENKQYIKLFGQPVKKETKPREKKEVETNLLRWVKLKATEIPETYRDEFIEYITNIGIENYDYFNDRFQLGELGESIIKGLYVWNEDEEKKLTYTKFAVAVEECMAKDLVIGMIKGTENLEDTTGSDGSWSDFADIMN